LFIQVFDFVSSFVLRSSFFLDPQPVTRNAQRVVFTMVPLAEVIKAEFSGPSS